MDAPGSGLSKRRLRMWLRMLGVTRSTETALRGYLRENHGTTLPRFEVLAALRRREEPTPMGELSRMLLVSNGNATDVVTRLEKDGLVLRTPCTADRGRAPGDGVGGRARSPSVAQRATGVTLAAIAGLRRRFGLRDLEPDGDDDDRRENGADRAG